MAAWSRLCVFLLLLGASAGMARSAPIAVNDSVYTPHNASIVISVLANDQPNGASPLNPASVTITHSAFGGSTQANANGTVTYTPNSGFGGMDQFEYTVRNMMGQVSNVAIVTVEVETNVSPEIVDFVATPRPSGIWWFSGRVIDEDCPNLTITFGGLLAGCTSPINDDGTFLFVKYIQNPHGIVSASTVDPYGRVSNTVQVDIGI